MIYWSWQVGDGSVVGEMMAMPEVCVVSAEKVSCERGKRESVMLAEDRVRRIAEPPGVNIS